MIPQFPVFKNLELSDKEAVEKFTEKYPAYSDFNFTSLWAWDTSGGRKICELNENLVILFTDYESQKPFFSFLGTNMVSDTATQILALAREMQIEPKLRLIPLEAAKDLDQRLFNVNEDVDNFDYIYSVNDLSALQGVKFKSKRQSADRFCRTHPGASFKVNHPSDKDQHVYMLLVMRAWQQNKHSKLNQYELTHEETTIRRLLKTANKHDVIAGSIYLDGKMVAFSLDEVLSNGYAIEHFSKANLTHSGVYDYLNLKMAEYLKSLGIEYWNWEQDLGIHSLRRSKASYRPISFLKKYTIEQK